MAAPLCEVCEKRRQVSEGLCRACVAEGLQRIKDEEDPNLKAYLELSTRPIGKGVTFGKRA